MTDYVVVLITVPTQEEAEQIAGALLEARLAACINIVGPVSSLFLWRGNIEKASERLLVVKTAREFFPRLADAVREMHSYDVPEIIALPIVVGEKDYLLWIDDEISVNG